MIVLIVAASGHSSRGQPFDGAVDGSAIVRRSTTPFFDAARVLITAGEDPATRFVMRHAGPMMRCDRP